MFLRLFPTIFLLMLVTVSGLCRAERYFDSATGVLALDSVRVGNAKYGNVRVKVQRVGKVSTLPPVYPSEVSFDPSARTLDLPTVVVGSEQFNNLRVVLDEYSVLAAESDATPAAAHKIAKYMQGTFTMNCNYTDTATNKDATGTETITIDSEGVVTGSGFTSFVSRPSDANYTLTVTDSVLTNPYATLILKLDGSLDTTTPPYIGCMHCGMGPLMWVNMPGVQACTGVSGKTAETFNALVKSLVSSDQLSCHSSLAEITPGMQTVSVGADRTFMVGGYYFLPAERFVISATPAGIVIKPYANPWMILLTEIIIDANTGRPLSLSFAGGGTLQQNFCIQSGWLD